MKGVNNRVRRGVGFSHSQKGEDLQKLGRDNKVGETIRSIVTAIKKKLRNRRNQMEEEKREVEEIQKWKREILVR